MGSGVSPVPVNPAGSAGSVVLLSGGIDSTTALAVAMREAAPCTALTFQYGQRHAAEVEAAAAIAARMGVEKHHIIPLQLGLNASSALTDPCAAMPDNAGKGRTAGSVPVTYVPARNTIFLACALALAEAAGADSIYIGVSSVDYSGYPDCRPKFIQAFQNLADVALKRSVEGRPVKIRAPLQYLNKARTIRKGVELGVDYSLTLSCYDPDEQARACGRCDSCRLRRKGFKEANVRDPACYRS